MHLRFPRPARRIALTVALCSLLATTAGCTSGSPTGSPGRPSQIRVVASTDVYGDIVRQLGGDAVAVTSLITDPSADPHTYEADTRNQLALSRADLVIENGGGYDDFVDTMLSSAGNTRATVVDVVELSGKKATATADLNEHVWYDFATMKMLTATLVRDLTAADPSRAATFAANGTAFTAALTRLEAREAAIRARFAGRGVAITEPVPLYLLTACGLVNRTPTAFSKAVEDGTDVSPRTMLAALSVFTGHQVALLAYNAQTTGASTDQAIAAAKANHVPVVAVTETLPAGKGYLAWMDDTLTAVDAALSR